MTPLIAASAFGHAEVMKILLKNGANIESQTVVFICYFFKSLFLLVIKMHNRQALLL